ncbi:MAG: hypothetical protein HRU19_10060 [Pseudobacteriovorax sp.]|nr:hypothetical protein [Pseudobacteriovorax sp.]
MSHHPKALILAASLFTSLPILAQSNLPEEFRTINGSRNNIERPNWGSAGRNRAGRPVINNFDAEYGVAPRSLPSARVISNAIARQESQTHIQHNFSDLFWLWGQFLDHDITLIPGDENGEQMPIPVPRGDRVLDPRNTGTQVIRFTRSKSVSRNNERLPVNTITSFIDASQVYGSDQRTARLLRDDIEPAYLAFSGDEFLPLIDDVPTDDGNTGRRGLFAAGDARANEHVGLTAMHTIFMREHNRLVPIVRQQHPGISEEETYQMARMVLGGIMQRITFEEFLPKLIGRPLPPYTGYNSSIDPRISNSFSTAAFRFGHSMLSSQLQILDFGETIPVNLKDLFFQPEIFLDFGPEPILAGFGKGKAQAIDVKIVEDVRSFLFGPPGSPGSDLAALNIQRGRDHELPSYNDMREALGYPRIERFLKLDQFDPQGITLDQSLAQSLRSVYDSPDRIDLWVGGLSEQPLFGSLIGPTFTSIIVEQFLRLRDGDRFWYESVFPNGYWRQYIERSTLSSVLIRNSVGGGEFDRTPFIAD